MATLQIVLFGRFRITRTDWGHELQLTRNVQAFLGYLLIHRHRVHSREVLAGIFWGDSPEEQARNCLNTMVWRLRRTLEPDPTPRGTYLVRTPLAEVGFNRNSDYWLDAAFFEKQLSRLLQKPAGMLNSAEAEALERALKLYTGDLLEGLYSDWALVARERMRALYLKGLEHLMGYYGHQREYEKAISYGKEILSHDNLREEIHRELMRYYSACGQRINALHHYKDCCKILRQELGISPLEETHALYRQINNMERNPTSDLDLSGLFNSAALEKSTGLDQVLDKLKVVLGDFETMSKQIAEIARFLERRVKT